jgi:hypothetical protein
MERERERGEKSLHLPYNKLFFFIRASFFLIIDITFLAAKKKKERKRLEFHCAQGGKFLSLLKVLILKFNWLVVGR